MERYQKRDAAWKLAQLATQIFIAQCPSNPLLEERDLILIDVVDQATDILTYSAASVGLTANDVGLEA